MMQFIRNKMNAIYSDFSIEIAKRDTLCDLKNVTFEGQNIPNYANPTHQQFYLLKYFPAYLVEYYKIYSQIIEQKFLEIPWNVLSIGFGCGIDYYGLYFAVKGKRLNFNNSVIYSGVDIIDWNYKDTLGNKHTRFLVQDISDWHHLDSKYNVIIFPKSIGEFSHTTFGRLEKILKESSFDNKKICLINSLREQRINFDIERFRRLSEILTKVHGYSAMDDVGQVQDFGSKGIRSICYDFVYPDGIKDFVTALLHQCQGYAKNQETPHRKDCKCLNRSPILKTDHIRYQVVKFQKN